MKSPYRITETERITQAGLAAAKRKPTEGDAPPLRTFAGKPPELIAGQLDLLSDARSAYRAAVAEWPERCPPDCPKCGADYLDRADERDAGPGPDRAVPDR